MQHSPRSYLHYFAALLMAALLCFYSTQALASNSAQSAQDYLNACKATYGNHEIIRMVVECIEVTFIRALVTTMQDISDFMAPTTFAIMAFSVVMIGIQVMAGIKELNKQVMLYFVKLGMVVWFAVNLGGFAQAPFDIVRYASALVNGNYEPWVQMDDYLCHFFGTNCSNSSQIFNGLMSLVGMSLTSGLQGILIFVLGNIAMLTSLYFIFRGVYNYLASIALIAFVVLLSPMIIPLALFQRTGRYVYKWLDYLLAAMLHPVLLFAFLYMFLGTLNYMLEWFIHGVMGGADFSQYWRNNQSMFSWILAADPQQVNQLGQVVGSEPGRTAVQSFVSPSMLSTVNVNPVSTFALDFGPNQVWAMQMMTFGFLGLFITSYLLISMLNHLPRISESISGVALGMSTEGIPLIGELKYGLAKLKAAVGS